MVIINSILLSLLIFIAAVIVHNLLTAENGKLRNIMIGYFITEIFMLFGFLWLEVYYGAIMANQTQMILFFALAPKVIAKIIFFNYTIIRK